MGSLARCLYLFALVRYCFHFSEAVARLGGSDGTGAHLAIYKPTHIKHSLQSSSTGLTDVLLLSCFVLLATVSRYAHEVARLGGLTARGCTYPTPLPQNDACETMRSGPRNV